MRKSTMNRKSGAAVAIGATLLLSSMAAFATNQLDCSRGNGRGNQPLRVVGLTDDGYLVCFNERAPRRLREIGYVSGLVAPDSSLIGIDFRVQDGMLYGVGNGGGVYRIDATNAAATRVNSLTVALAGDSFGVDFNPAADRLRIVSNTGQNLRHDVNAGLTTADLTLNYAPGITAPGIVGAAYTNNDLDVGTATTLFDLDANLDQIAVQAPPNNGSLGATGKLNVDAGPAAGFDIYSRLEGGVSDGNRGFAAINVAGDYAFYRIGLLSGRTDYVGSFKRPIVDIAVPL
jgi:Domain of unknown function (DUF4394)